MDLCEEVPLAGLGSGYSLPPSVEAGQWVKCLNCKKYGNMMPSSMSPLTKAKVMVGYRVLCMVEERDLPGLWGRVFVPIVNQTTQVTCRFFKQSKIYLELIKVCSCVDICREACLKLYKSSKHFQCQSVFYFYRVLIHKKSGLAYKQKEACLCLANPLK